MKVTEFETIVEQHAEANESLKASKALLDEEKDNIQALIYFMIILYSVSFLFRS